MKITSLLMNLGLIFSASISTAQTDVLSAESFKQDIEQFTLLCKSDCQGTDYTIATVYENPKIIGDLSQKSKLDLIKIAGIQAQIWGDTILEGDYVASGHTSLDIVEKIYLKNRFLGYRIYYSEKAWFTGDCEYNPDDLSKMDQCVAGRIHERSYVSPDMKTYFVNDDDYAQFE